MVKKNRKVHFCQFHNKKHYQAAQKKRCQYEKSLLKTKKLIQQSQNSTVEKDDFQKQSQISSTSNFPEINNQVDQCQDSQLLAQRFDHTPFHFKYGPQIQSTSQRAKRLMKQRLLLRKNILDASDFQQIQNAGFDAIKTRQNLKGYVFQLEGQVQSLKCSIVKAQTKEELSLKISMETKLEKIRKLKLEIDPHCMFDYIQLPKFQGVKQAQSFLENLPDWQVNIYHPQQFISFVYNINKCYLHQWQKQKNKKRVLCTRSGSYTFSQQNIKICSLYYEMQRDQSKQTRKYVKSGKYKQLTDYQKRIRGSFAINYGFKKALQRHQTHGAYRYRLLKGQAKKYGLQSTNDNQIRRLRFNLINNPWSRLCFSQQTIDSIFGRNVKTKTINKIKGSHNRQTYRTEQDNITLFIQSHHQPIPLKLRRQTQRNGTLFDPYQTKYPWYDSDGQLRQPTSPSLNQLLQSESQQSESQQIIQHENNNVLSENICDIQQQQSGQQIQLTVQFDKCTKQLPPINQCFQKYKIIPQVDFIRRNMAYMTQTQKINMINRAYNRCAFVDYFKKLQSSRSYFSCIEDKFQFHAKNKDYQGWVQFMKTYKVPAKIIILPPIQNLKQKEMTWQQTARKMYCCIQGINEPPSTYCRFTEQFISKLIAAKNQDDDENKCKIRQMLELRSKYSSKMSDATMDQQQTEQRRKQLLELSTMIKKQAIARQTFASSNKKAFWRRKFGTVI